MCGGVRLRGGEGYAWEYTSAVELSQVSLQERQTQPDRLPAVCPRSPVAPPICSILCVLEYALNADATVAHALRSLVVAFTRRQRMSAQTSWARCVMDFGGIPGAVARPTGTVVLGLHA